jgi:hypothetical protein
MNKNIFHINPIKFWNKSGIDTASFWAYFLLWNKPSIKESYEYIKKKKLYLNYINEH